jgi:hypothetical protein
MNMLAEIAAIRTPALLRKNCFREIGIQQRAHLGIAARVTARTDLGDQPLARLLNGLR